MSWLDQVGKKIGNVLGFNEEEDIRGGMRAAREAAERRANEKYEKFKVNPDLLKQEYGQYVQRALQQQAGGLTAALSSQRRVNPALASHTIANTTAQMGAQAAGETALAQTQLGYQGDIYNRQLLQGLQQNELAGAQAEENAYAQARQGQHGFLRNLVQTGATLAMNYLMPKAPGGGKTGTGVASSTGQTFAPSSAPSSYSLGLGNYSDERLKTPTFSHDHAKDPSYHEMLGSFLSDDHTETMSKMAREHKSSTKFQSPTSRDLQEFEGSLQPFKYAYKEGSVADDGGAEHVTPMAQNIEKSKIGKTVVKKDKQGYRQLDIPQLTSALAGSIYDLNNRLKRLEGSRA